MGGAQKVAYDIISSLHEIKYDITLVTSPGGELIEWINKLNASRNSRVNIITLSSLKREISPVNDLKAFLKLYKIIKKGRYNITHFHSSKMGILGRCAAWLARVPKIFFTVHGWGINEYQGVIKQKILGLFEKLAGKLCTKVICVSNYDMYKGIKNKWINNKKVCVIYNGIDECNLEKGRLREELNISDDIAIIGTIERLQKPKEPLFTIEVFNELKNRGYKVKLVIIGDGPLRKRCIDLINDLELQNDVFLLGTREDARELLNDIDIFTLFSKWEGLPLTIIEAMFAGKPIVASNVTGVPELVQNGDNGYLAKKLDITQVADYVESLLDDDSLREKMGTASKNKMISRLTLRKMLESYQQIYLD